MLRAVLLDEGSFLLFQFMLEKELGNPFDDNYRNCLFPNPQFNIEEPVAEAEVNRRQKTKLDCSTSDKLL